MITTIKLSESEEGIAEANSPKTRTTKKVLSSQVTDFRVREKEMFPCNPVFFLDNNFEYRRNRSAILSVEGFCKRLDIEFGKKDYELTTILLIPSARDELLPARLPLQDFSSRHDIPLIVLTRSIHQ